MRVRDDQADAQATAEEVLPWFVVSVVRDADGEACSALLSFDGENGVWVSQGEDGRLVFFLTYYDPVRGMWRSDVP